MMTTQYDTSTPFARWLGDPTAPVDVELVLRKDDVATPEVLAIGYALLDAAPGELRLRFRTATMCDGCAARVTAEYPRVMIAGKPYGGPVRFASLLAAALLAVRAHSSAAPSRAMWRSAMKVSLACIRSALDNARACVVDTDRNAWLELAESEERRVEHLVDRACASSFEWSDDRERIFSDG